MKIITFSGIDGSGKSTQAKLLIEYLDSLGKKVHYFHAIKFSLANMLTRKEIGRTGGSVTKANALQMLLRKKFLFWDLLRFRILYKKLKRQGYDYIVSDRYFTDTVINLNYLIKNKKNYFRSLIMQPDLAFYLRLSPETVMSRERTPDQNMEYLTAKNNLFESKIKDYNFITLDANQSKEVIFEEIKKQLM